ncbi:MAG: hypothetical protein V2A79_18570 [Planctomycetota bacterium]
MGRLLNLEGFLCRKIMAGSREKDGLAVVAKLPGIEGLRQFCQAARSFARDARVVDELTTAVDRYEACLKQWAGSQTELLAMIAGEIPEQREKAYERSRTALFRAAREFTGRSCAVHLSLWAIRPYPDDPSLLDIAQVRGAIGLERLGRAAPITFGWTIRERDWDPNQERVRFRSFEGEELEGMTPGALLNTFCSSPLPALQSLRRGPHLVHLVDLNTVPVKRPIDILTGAWSAGVMAHPIHDPKRALNIGTSIDVPAKRLLFDVYLHRSLATMCIASLDIFFMGIRGPAEYRDERWFDRYPPAAHLQHLGPGIAQTATPVYAQHARLTHYVFDSLGWRADEFVGYRCLTRYPPWPLQNLMGFDFPQPEPTTQIEAPDVHG